MNSRFLFALCQITVSVMFDIPLWEEVLDCFEALYHGSPQRCPDMTKVFPNSAED